MTSWKPKESDIEWMKTLLSSIKVGGRWFTSYSVYEKAGPKKVRLIVASKRPEDRNNLRRTRIAIKAAGYEYEEEI